MVNVIYPTMKAMMFWILKNIAPTSNGRKPLRKQGLSTMILHFAFCILYLTQSDQRVAHCLFDRVCKCGVSHA